MRFVSVLGLLLMLSGCSTLFFYPTEEHVQTPEDQGLEYEDVYLEREDGPRLHGWWLPAATDEVKGTVYHLHGNAQNISTHLMSVFWLPEQGYQVFLLDYRGYGKSEGRARIAGALDDVQMGLDWLLDNERTQGPVILLGQSLGGSLGAAVLGREQNEGKADCVILEAAFTGYRDITRDVMRQTWLLWPFSFVMAPLMPGSDNPIDRIDKIAPRPLMIMHSKEDEVIPFEHGQRLFEEAGEPKEFIRLYGRHGQGTAFPTVRRKMLEFMSGECQ